MRERINSAPAPELNEHLFGPLILEGLEQKFQAMSDANKAHIVMLFETGIISEETATLLAKALKKIDRDGPEALDLDASKEDLFFILEGAVTADVGHEIGGQLHTGRSRNDLYAATQRMMVREKTNALSLEAITVIDRLLDLADDHLETVMTGYTHMQPAQPITLGHYFSAIADALLRDINRILRSYETTNRSPLGACALATTGFPIDRDLTARLLGFDGLIENSLDAVAARDYLSETLFGYTSLATTISRLAHDLHVWYTHEFAYIDIAGEAANASSIMPQKKNPGVIEHLKAKASHLIGALVSSLSCQKTVAYSNAKEAGWEGFHPIEEAHSQIEATLALTSLVLRSLVVNSEVMQARAASNLSTVTELADVMVRDADLPFRVSYQIVGTLVRESIERGNGSTKDFTAESVEQTAKKIMGQPVRLPDDAVTKALDPMENVFSRSVVGGPAPETVAAMIGRARSEMGRQESLVSERASQLIDARSALNERVLTMSGEGG